MLRRVPVRRHSERHSRLVVVRCARLLAAWLCGLMFLPATPAPSRGAAQGPPFVPDQIIVKLAPSVTAIDAIALTASVDGTVAQRYASIGAELWEISGIGVEDAVKRLQRDPRVLYAEPNFVLKAHDLVPNDPFFASLWGMRNTGQQGGTPGADIDAPGAWSTSTGAPILVGVIDSGVDMNHADLAGRIYTNPGEIAGNGVDDDHNGFVDDVHGWNFAYGNNNPNDDYGHGTHTSGTIAAVGNNGVGVAGVCWSATILPIKFLDSFGFGTTDAAIRSVQYATLMGARLTNNSWGGGAYSQALRDAIQAAANAGILFVASAGNDGWNTDIVPVYPAGYDVDNIIVVGATERHDLLSSFSNYGAISVDLCAPGSEILSTIPGNLYQVASGTSMSAPHVSGSVALVWSVAPQLTSAEVKSLLLATVDKVPALTGKCATGGRLDVHGFIARLDSLSPDPVADLAVDDTGSTSARLAWSATGDDGATGTAARYDLRYSTSPIDSANFAGATPVTGIPSPQVAGTAESFEVPGLAYDTAYYFALVVEDDAGRRSALSNVAATTTLGPPHLAFAPPALAVSQHRGGRETRVLVLRNVAEGTLDFVARGPAWAGISPASARIASGDSLRVDVTFDATNLAAGDHDSTLTLSTNAPGQANVDIPVSLHVTDAADITAEPARLDFGERYTGTCAVDSLEVVNIGSIPLEVSAVAVSLPAFTHDASPFTIGPGEARTVLVTFCPQSAVEHVDSLVITSNDPDHPSFRIPLAGHGVEPPVVGVMPSSFAENLYTGGTAGHVLSIANRGGSDLDFEVRLETADSLSASIDVMGAAAPGAAIAVGRPLDAAQLAHLNASVPRRVDVPRVSAPDRDATPRRGDVARALPRLTTGGFEEVFGGGENEFLGAERSRGNIFACTADTRLLEHRFYMSTAAATALWFLVYEGHQQAGDYALVSASNLTPAGPGEGWYSSGHVDVPLIAGRFYLVMASWEEEAAYFNDSTISPYPVPASFGELIAGAGWTWEPQTVFPPAPVQMVPSAAFSLPAAYYQTIVTSGVVRWCSVAPDAGTVVPGAAVDLQVGLDAAGLNGGDYAARLRVSSNDPQTPEIDVPVSLHVTGAPDIEISKAAIDFGTRFTGAAALDTLTVTNAGTDALSISSIAADLPVYLTLTPAMILAPGESRDVIVVFTPALPGSFPATLTLQSDDPDEPLVAVPVSGAAVEPPVIGIDPRALAHDLFTGGEATDSLVISNSGVSPLEFVITAEKADATAAAWREPAMPLRPAGSRPGASSHAPHEAGSITALAGSVSRDPSVLIIQDQGAWGVNMQAFVQGNFGILATLIDSQHIDATDFLEFDLVITTGDQTTAYYDALSSHRAKFEDFVSRGGVVQHQLATQGDNVTLAGGMTAIFGSREAYNEVALPLHPIVKNLPALLQGDLANHTYFTGVPANAQIITRANQSRAPTTVEYRFGAGRVIATGMTWEFLWQYQYPAGAMMRNAVAYALSLAGVPWVDYEPASGTVAPGASLPVAVRMNAAGLYSGVYRANLFVRSNDPVTPVVDVSAELNVTGAPVISVSDTLLDFGPQYVGATPVDSITIVNAGSVPLVVSGLSLDNSAYTLDVTGFELEPGTQRAVRVTFAPRAAADMPGVLTITSNAIGDSVVTVQLRGEGIEAPVIGVEPSSFTENMLAGEGVTRTLTVHNDGGSPLSFAIGTQYLDPVRASAATRPPLDGAARSRDLTPAAAIRPGATGRAWAGPARGSRASTVERAAPDPAGAGGLNLLLLQSGGVAEIRGRLLEFPDIAIVDEFDIGAATPALSTLSNYDAAIIINTFLPVNPDSLGNVLADYVDQGGGVIMTLASFIGGWDVGGRFQADGYFPFALGYGPVGSAAMSQFDAGHPIMQGVTAATGDYLGGTTVAPGADDVAWWSNGFPFIATRGTRVVGVNVFLADGGYWTGDVPRILRNAAGWAAGRAWLTADPAGGVIAPHGNAEIDVTVNAGRLTGGDYRANLGVTSNDPVNGLVAIPVNLHVTGVPDIAVTDTLLDFGAQFLGATAVDSLLLRNTGSDLLTVSSITMGHPDFTVDGPGFALAPGATRAVRVTFAPTQIGSIVDTLTIESDDPDEGRIRLLVSGSGTQPAPVISISPSDLLLFENVPRGGHAEKVVRVSNSGIGPLTVSRVAADHPWFVVDPGALVVPENSTRDVRVSFQPAAAGSVLGSLEFTSNDADHGSVSLVLAGLAVEPPVIGLSVEAWIDTLPPAGASSQVLTVRNTGGGTLNVGIRMLETTPAPVAARPAGTAMARPAARRLHGGPDAFGYRWRDNNGSGGPVFEWIDAQDGSNVLVYGDGFVDGIPLGFVFEYYGVAHTTIGASANGWLGFAGAANGFPAQVPFADNFDGVIAPMARDLDAARYVRCKTTGDAPHRKFVIEYNGIWNGPNAALSTFEVVLFETTNSIRFQYLTAGTAPVGFGIESPDESTGLGNAPAGGQMDPAMVQDGYAIEFSTVPAWLHVDPLSATVPAGGSADFMLMLAPADIEEGDYSADVVFTSNDPQHPAVVVPVSLLVAGHSNPVLITRFEAMASKDAVDLRWDLSADEEILGFRIYRFDDRAGLPVDITAREMLRADARSYRDMNARRAIPYRYQLAVVLHDREAVSALALVELAPYEFALEQNSPNPFNPSTTISFTLAERSRVLLAIFDVGGRPVQTLVDAILPPGPHRYPWNGQNMHGEVASSGVYFFRLTSGKQTLTRKMVLLK